MRYNILIEIQAKSKLSINELEDLALLRELGLVPILALEKEKDFLSSLLNNTIRNHYKIKMSSLKVSSQSTITYQKRKYVVPPG